MASKRKALEDEDEAFPRGRPSADADAGNDDETAARTTRVPPKGDKTRRKRAKTAEKVEEEEEDDTTAGVAGAVQVEAPKNAARLRSLDLVEGAMLMAAVREVHDDEITLSLPFNMTGYVSRVQAAETGEMAAQPPPLPEAYPVGRLVVAVVTAVVEVGKKEDGRLKKSRIELSLRPSLANAGLTAEDITPHMWLPAVVQSEEEHVFKLGFGVSGLQGLLKKTEALKLGKLPSPGSIVQVGVQSCNAAAGLVRCTATTAESLGSSTLKLESLKAGFLVHARIDKLLACAKSGGPDGFSNNGAVASFCGSLTGVINWHYQCQGAADSPELMRKQRVTARVLAIVPGPKVLVHLALLPHLLDWTSQSELLTSVKIGDRLDGHVLDLLPKYGCRLRCMRRGEKLPLLGFCPASYMTDTDAAEAPAGLSSGSKTACRVLSYNFFDAALVVTRRQNDLQEDTLISVTELSPGQLVVGEITRVAEYGVFVRLSEFITSLVHLRQLTDVPLATVPSRFQVGTKVKCRVLKVNPEKRQAMLTAKKALVRGDFQLAAFEQSRKDMLVTGYVSKVQDYGAIVSFFGDVFGLLPAEEMEKDEAPALGMAVHCRISNYNKKRRRLALSVDLANGRAPADFAGSSDPAFQEDGAWAPGSMASVQVVECVEAQASLAQGQRAACVGTELVGTAQSVSSLRCKMARGPCKHLKRMFAPSHWMLDKLKGRWAPRPSAGPHKMRECLPLIVMLRNRLKYALTYRECKMIVMQRLIKVDGKIRTDMFFPAGFMDVVQIEKTKENFRLLYDTKGRFVLHKVVKEEATYKLCRVKKVERGPKGIPYAITHDGRTIRYPDPDVSMFDTVRIDIATNKILDHVKFEIGNTVMIGGGNNMGRVGQISHREKHPGSFEIIHVKDAVGHSFATRLQNVFVIGKGNKPWISLPKGNGIKLNIIEDRNAKMTKK